MTVVSTQEFNANQEKYFNLAIDEQVFIQKDNYMFIVQNVAQNIEQDVVFEPDEDFHRSIPIEEVRDKVVGYIRKKHAK